MEQDPWDKVPELDRYVMGRPAIEVYALVKSDVSVYDPVVQAALQHLAGLKPSLTYCVAIYLMALDARTRTDRIRSRPRPRRSLSPDPGDRSVGRGVSAAHERT